MNVEKIKLSQLPVVYEINAYDLSVISQDNLTKGIDITTALDKIFDLIELPEGSNPIGKKIEIAKNDSYIQWRYSEDDTWNNLINNDTLNGISGTNSKNIELRRTSSFIQWNTVGENNWDNLFSLDEIKGDRGEIGENGIKGSTGGNGRNGINTSKILIRKNDHNTIEWKREEDNLWTVLVNKVDLDDSLLIKDDQLNDISNTINICKQTLENISSENTNASKSKTNLDKALFDWKNNSYSIDSEIFKDTRDTTDRCLQYLKNNSYFKYQGDGNNLCLNSIQGRLNNIIINGLTIKNFVSNKKAVNQETKITKDVEKYLFSNEGEKYSIYIPNRNNRAIKLSVLSSVNGQEKIINIDPNQDTFTLDSDYRLVQHILLTGDDHWSEKDIENIDKAIITKERLIDYINEDTGMNKQMLSIGDQNNTVIIQSYNENMAIQTDFSNDEIKKWESSDQSYFFYFLPFGFKKGNMYIDFYQTGDIRLELSLSNTPIDITSHDTIAKTREELLQFYDLNHLRDNGAFLKKDYKYVTLVIRKLTEEASVSNLIISQSPIKSFVAPEIYTTSLKLKDSLKGISPIDSDYITYENNKLIRTTWYKEIILTGDENESWDIFPLDKNPEGFIGFRLNANLKNFFMSPRFVCNLFHECGQSVFRGDNYEGIAINPDGNIYIRMRKSLLKDPSLEGLKEWLKENNINIIYKLKQPIISNIDNEVLNVITYNNSTWIRTIVDNQIIPNITFNIATNIGTLLQNSAKDINAIWNKLNDFIIPSLFDLKGKVLLKKARGDH